MRRARRSKDHEEDICEDEQDNHIEADASDYATEDDDEDAFEEDGVGAELKIYRIYHFLDHIYHT